MHPCPCCGNLTLAFADHSESDICEVCLWQNDLLGFENPSQVRGPNRVSLNEARRNYRKLGVSDPRFSGLQRAPKPHEIPR